MRKCETCHYEQWIRTAGTHVTENGSIQVFVDDDDEFLCPNCDVDTPNTDEINEGS